MKNTPHVFGNINPEQRRIALANIDKLRSRLDLVSTSFADMHKIAYMYEPASILGSKIISQTTEAVVAEEVKPVETATEPTPADTNNLIDIDAVREEIDRESERSNGQIAA